MFRCLKYALGFLVSEKKMKMNHFDIHPGLKVLLIKRDR